MSMIYVLIPLAVLLIAAAVWALVWAIRSGQFDDLDAQGWSVVLDDDEKPPATADGPDERQSGDMARGQDHGQPGGQAGKPPASATRHETGQETGERPDGEATEEHGHQTGRHGTAPRRGDDT